MMQKRDEVEFFLKYSVVGVLFSAMLMILGIDFQRISFFSLHYFWHLALLSPYVATKYNGPKFRYSFLRYLIKFHDFILGLDPFQKNMFTPQLARFLGPLFFTGALLFINQNIGTLLFGILGSLSIEAYASLRSFYEQV